MAQLYNRLSARHVDTLTSPGRHADGRNLFLKIGTGGRRNWVFLYQINGQRREMGLGAAGRLAVGLAEARALAEEARRLLREGRDPIEARKSQFASTGAGKTFREVAELFISEHELSWKNPKHREQWRSTLQTYVYPEFGSRTIASVDKAMVLEVLKPIWSTKTETAARLRGRIELVLDYARAHDWRSGENPARWRGNLAMLLPRRSKVSPVKHQPALPWQDIGAFMRQLRAREADAARALELLILTATRTSEVLGATWRELDLKGGVWTIPSGRTKAGRPHRVPLAEPARKLLRQVFREEESAPEAFVFERGDTGSALSSMALLMLLRRMGQGQITTHGFRSTFRTWAGDMTVYPREVAEAALGHVIRDKTEAAYARSDLFEKRAMLMADWATFCGRIFEPAEIVPLARKKNVP